MFYWMRSIGSPAELEHRRYLAIRRLLEGSSSGEVAEFLDVELRSVQRWWRIFLQRGWKGLAATAGAGRPQKLTSTQEKIAIRWLQDKPTDFGFTTELWTCRRLSGLIWQEWRIRLQPRYLPRWLRERGFTLQKPERVPRERNHEAIARWLATDWPRIKKKRRRTKPTSL
jgi:transposase